MEKRGMDLEARVSRWKSIMDDDGGDGFLFIIKLYDKSLGQAPKPWPEKKAERVEHIWRAYLSREEHCASIDDDSLPYLNMLGGTEIFAEAFGCAVHKPADNMPFALPLIHSAEEVSKVKVPRLGSCALDYLFEMADDLKARAGKDALMRIVDLQSPMDIANLIWEKESLLMGMYEAPEAVKELSAKVQELMTEFLDEWFRRYGQSLVAHFPDYYMEKGITLSVDEVGIVSSEMFEEFFKPELEALSTRYGGIGVHCCADARHQWANFRSLKGLKLINFVKPPTRECDYISEGMEFFAGKCLQWHYGFPFTGAPTEWRGQCPDNSRIVLEFDVKSLEEAKETAKKLRDASSRKLALESIAAQ